MHQTIHDVLNFFQLFWCLIRLGDESWMITYLIILIYFIILHTYIPNELTQLGSQCEYDLTPWQHFSSTYRVVLCRIFSLNCFFTNLPKRVEFFLEVKHPFSKEEKDRHYSDYPKQFWVYQNRINTFIWHCNVWEIEIIIVKMMIVSRSFTGTRNYDTRRQNRKDEYLFLIGWMFQTHVNWS